MKMIEKLNAAILATLESATLDYEQVSREKTYTKYTVRIGAIPVTLEWKNTTGRKRTEKQAANDWQQYKFDLYTKRLAEFQSKKIIYELDSSYEQEGYRTSYRPNDISCYAVDNHGWIIEKRGFYVPEEWFEECEDYIKGGAVV